MELMLDIVGRQTALIKIVLDGSLAPSRSSVRHEYFGQKVLRVYLAARVGHSNEKLNLYLTPNPNIETVLAQSE